MLCEVPRVDPMELPSMKHTANDSCPNVTFPFPCELQDEEEWNVNANEQLQHRHSSTSKPGNDDAVSIIDVICNIFVQ